jgi:hypothetical protein
MKIHNVMTNIVGRTKTERQVAGIIWRTEIQPVLESLLSGKTGRRKALIGQWVVEALTNDPHLDEFFSKNWKTADAEDEPDVKCYSITGIQNKELMMKLLGLKTEGDVIEHRDLFLKALEDKKFKASIRDARLANIDKASNEEQLYLALFAPATVYCAETFSFASFNTNYYGQLKSKSSLGPLEEYLIRKAKTDFDGRIQNPKDVWLSMHAGCIQYQTASDEKRGIVIIAPTGSGKSTHCYGLVDAKKQNKLHSDDWVFVNIGTRDVLISENQFYMRTNIAGIYPHLIPSLVPQPLENVPFSKETLEQLEPYKAPKDLAAAIEKGKFPQDAYGKLIEQMVENNSARSLIDPRVMVGKDKFIEKAVLTDLVLMKRDYDSPMILEKLDEEGFIRVLISKGNVYNYVYGKNDADGYGVPQPRTAEIYYNPYLCNCEVDSEKGVIGELDRIRIEAYSVLVKNPSVTAVWANTRLPASQMQFCLRRFFEGGVDAIHLEKGKDANVEVLKQLQLTAKPKPAARGRREMDLTGFYDSKGREVEVVSFMSGGKCVESLAFLKDSKEVSSYSGGSVADFLKKYAFLGAKQLLT